MLLYNLVTLVCVSSATLELGSSRLAGGGKVNGCSVVRLQLSIRMSTSLSFVSVVWVVIKITGGVPERRVVVQPRRGVREAFT